MARESYCEFINAQVGLVQKKNYIKRSMEITVCCKKILYASKKYMINIDI